MNLRSIFEIEEALGLPLVTPDMQACVHLYLFGPVPSLTLQMNLRISASGFYAVQRRLKDRGIIEGHESAEDKRVTLYDLAPSVRQMFEERIGKPELHLMSGSDENQSLTGRSMSRRITPKWAWGAAIALAVSVAESLSSNVLAGMASL